MTWTTNPIAKRFRQTVGWTSNPPDYNLKKSTASPINIQTLKNLGFIKEWLKHNRWYLLGLQQMWTNRLQLYYITALRMPKIKLSRRQRPRRMKLHLLNENLGRAVDYGVGGNINLLRRHFKRRRKLFEYIKNSKWTKIRTQRLSANKNVQATVCFKQTNIESSLRKCWLMFLANHSDSHSNLLKTGITSAKSFHKTRQLHGALNLLQSNVYCMYDFALREWGSNLRLRRKIILSNAETVLTRNMRQLLPQKTIKINKNKLIYKSKYLEFAKLNVVTPIKSKYLQKYSKASKLYLSVLQKRKKKRRIKLQILNAFARTKKQKRAILRYTAVFYKIRSKLNKVYGKTLLIKYNKRQKTLIRKRTQYSRVRYYKLWRAKYIYIKRIKNKLLKQFFSMFNLFHDLRKAIHRATRNAFINSWRNRKMVLYHPKADALREKWRIDQQKSRINKYVGGYNPKLNINKNRFFRFAFGWHIAKLWKRRKRRKKKLILSTYRLNFIFKKVLRKIFKTPDNGTIIIRFLQPDRLLLSTKKLRKIAKRHHVVRRYRRQRMYKRILPFIAVMFRYWNAQPLIEQIAFELEKTKKHWPVLKTIRAMIQYLKPPIYAGYRISIRGKINSSKRTRTFYIEDGRLPYNTFRTRMTFAFYQSNARIGSFGLKSWMYFSADK